MGKRVQGVLVARVPDEEKMMLSDGVLRVLFLQSVGVHKPWPDDETWKQLTAFARAIEAAGRQAQREEIIAMFREQEKKMRKNGEEWHSPADWLASKPLE